MWDSLAWSVWLAFQLRDMLAAYNPWGKPGNGAPMPGALRKTKWVFQEPCEAVSKTISPEADFSHLSPVDRSPPWWPSAGQVTVHLSEPYRGRSRLCSNQTRPYTSRATNRPGGVSRTTCGTERHQPTRKTIGKSWVWVRHCYAHTTRKSILFICSQMQSFLKSRNGNQTNLRNVK